MGILSARFLVSELWRLNQDVIVVGEGDGVMEDVEEYLDRGRKRHKYARIACGQFLRKLLKVLDKQQFSCSVYPTMPTGLHCYP